jgi:hypothetical protein
MLRPFVLVLAAVAIFISGPRAAAHPIPDVPVHAFFEEGGACRIQIEIDPRCFEADPNTAPSVLNEALLKLPESQRAEWIAKARAFAQATVEFFFEPLGKVVPDFSFEFTTHAAFPLGKPDDVVVLTGTWRTTVPAGMNGYRIRALEPGKLSVLFLNTIRGANVERMAVLFPGESSFLLDLTSAQAANSGASLPGSVGVTSGADGWGRTFWQFVRQGFLHVMPEGLDHILFVLGLFLLSRDWRALLWQVSTFTVAHTLTLALATLGWVSVPASVVEPIIAGSIAVVALENIFHPRYTPWRLILVFIFGLVHGLGFAGALRALQLPTPSLIVGLLGFNVGVEGGQLAVISIALAATFWLRDPAIYRKAVVVPGSLIIAAAGLWWMVQRAGWV